VKYYTNKARQAGMTLIELTVVLLVLIGLAGLMIPYVSGFVTKTHDATGSDSLASLNSAIQRYDVQFLGQPAGYDSLMSSVTTATPIIYSKLMNGDDTTTLITDTYLKVATIPQKSLSDVGISSVMLMDNTTSDATFAATGAVEPIAATGDMALLALNVKNGTCPMSVMGCIEDDAELSDILGRSVNTSANDYVIFGVGQDSAMVGKTVSEAPVHFAKTGAMSAANKYNRILAVYQVPKLNTCIASNGQGFTSYADSTANSTEIAIGGMADCTAAGALTTAVFWDGVSAGTAVSIGSTSFSGTMAQKATFVTTAMPMMMLEGLGGALASHYSSVDN